MATEVTPDTNKNLLEPRLKSFLRDLLAVRLQIEQRRAIRTDEKEPKPPIEPKEDADQAAKDKYQEAKTEYDQAKKDWDAKMVIAQNVLDSVQGILTTPAFMTHLVAFSVERFVELMEAANPGVVLKDLKAGKLYRELIKYVATDEEFRDSFVKTIEFCKTVVKA